MKKTACFFSNESIECIEQEQYSIQDINILKDLGYEVIIANNFSKIPFDCDLYFSWWASGSILPLVKAKLSSTPIIVVAGGNETMFYKDSLYGIPAGYLATPWYKKIATRLTLKLASRVLVVSNFMLRDTIRLGAKKPIMVHNSVNITKFNLSDKKRKFITIIFKSEKNVVRLKRGEIFIRSIPDILKVYPDQKFIIIGAKDNYFEYLKALCVELGVDSNVNFVGSIKNESVVEWMQKSIVYVQISDTETFGVAIAEAMSCGTHVVVSNRGAIPEVVGPFGNFVDHNAPQTVSAAILKILNYDGKQYVFESKKIRNHIIENFSYEIRKNKIETIIQELLK